MVTQQHSASRHIVSPRHLCDMLVLQQRTPGAPQRTIRRDVDALASAEVDHVLLWQIRVVFDLIDGRHGGDVGEEFLEELHAVIGYPDHFHFARVQEALHLLVGLDMCPGRVKVPAAVGVFGESGVVACAC